MTGNAFSLQSFAKLIDTITTKCGPTVALWLAGRLALQAARVTKVKSLSGYDFISL
jgi:hypothetical protein